jgi:hypothetical protein
MVSALLTIRLLTLSLLTWAAMKRAVRQGAQASAVVVVAVSYVLLNPSAAPAEPITFEDVLADSPAAMWTPAASYISGEGRFTPSFQSLALVTQGALCSPSCPSNGTNYLLVSTGHTAPFNRLMMTAADSHNNFAFVRFDAGRAEALSSVAADQLRVTAEYDNTGEHKFTTATFDLSAAGDFQTFTLPLLFQSNVRALWFEGLSTNSSARTSFALDNIDIVEGNVSAPPNWRAPEPSALLLLTLGAGMLGVTTLRRTRR